MILQTPKLDSLQVKAPNATSIEATSSIRHIKFPVRGEGSGKLNLRRLELANWCLSFHHYRISSYVDHEKLATLKLDDCLDCGPFLTKLSRVFARGNGALKALYINQGCWDEDEDRRDDFSRDVDHFLLSFKGLETLYLSFDQLVSAKSIINHSQTLTSLGIGSNRGPIDGYSLPELKSILRACKLLTQLGLELCTTTEEWESLRDDLFIDPANREWSHLTTAKGNLVCPTSILPGAYKQKIPGPESSLLSAPI